MRTLALASLLAILSGSILAGCLAGDDPPTTPLPAADPVPYRSRFPPPNLTALEPALAAPIPPTAIGHTFFIVLENHGYDTNFGTDVQSEYLGVTLPAMGRLLTNYYATSHASTGNYITLVSGQAPNPQTQGDCLALVTEFVGVANGPDGQAIGHGCVYPPEVLTIGDQMEAAGLTWRQYAEDMAAIDDPDLQSCRHVPVNSNDGWQGGTDGDNYATRHVGFMFFHSIIDDQASCAEHNVDLELLRTDLQSLNTTPNYSFITPDTCSDGHDAECATAGQNGGYAGMNDFLTEWVPLIMNSTAFQQDGLIVVTFDESSVEDASACCGEPAGYNTAMPGIVGPGGGRVGGVLISPCIEAGSIDETPYNHYSMLRTWEDIFGLPYLGYAGMDGLVPLDLGTCNPA